MSNGFNTLTDAYVAYDEWNTKANAACDAYNSTTHPWEQARHKANFEFCVDMRNAAEEAIKTLGN